MHENVVKMVPLLAITILYSDKNASKIFYQGCFQYTLDTNNCTCEGIDLLHCNMPCDRNILVAECMGKGKVYRNIIILII